MYANPSVVMKKPVLLLACAIIAITSNAQIGIGTTSPNTTLDVRGSLAVNSRSFATTSESVSSTDYTLLFTGNAAATLTLPDATGCTGRLIHIKNTNSGTVPTLTIATTASQTIDGSSTWLLDDPNESINVVSDGANWLIMASGSGTSWTQGGNSVSSEKKLGTIDAYALPFITDNTERMRISETGNVGIGSSDFDATAPEKLLIDAGNTSSYNLIGAYGNRAGYLQFNIQNTNTGGSASTDIVATADNGTETTNYVDLGINGGGYNNASNILSGPNNGYLYSAGRNFIVGNSSASYDLIFFTGGIASSNERMRILSGGNVGINTTAPNSTFEVNGSVGNAITTTNNNITLGSGHYTVILTGGSPSVTLPAPASGNTRRIYIIVNQTSGARTISTYKSFSGSDATTIAANSSMTIQSDGTNWYRIQ